MILLWIGAAGVAIVQAAQVDYWLTIPNSDAPTPRFSHTSIWDGMEVIVWGGTNGTTVFNTGGRYNPSTNSWRPTSTAGAPTPRAGQAAMWIASPVKKMWVWGGFDGTTVVNTGGLYDPANDTWRATSMAGAPTPRVNFYSGSVVVATPSGQLLEIPVVLWGGTDATFTPLNTGALYNPVADTWTPITTMGAPTARSNHTFSADLSFPLPISAKMKYMVWGGLDVTSTPLNTGALYDPAADNWAATTTVGAPTGRFGHTATVLPDGRVLIVAGFTASGVTNTGAHYHPLSNTWQQISTVGAPTARRDQTAVFAGPPVNKVIVWGGSGLTGPFNTGGLYDSNDDTWTPTTTVGAPTPRDGHTAVWTGAAMIVWGGNDGVPTNTGAVYHIPLCKTNLFDLCLFGGRFDVQARWSTPDGRSGSGNAVSLTSDTGYLWFFNPGNVEMIVKVLNACGINQRIWVFAAGLTNVQVDVTVTDLLTGSVKTYQNPQNTAFQPIQDTDAFPTCSAGSTSLARSEESSVPPPVERIPSPETLVPKWFGANQICTGDATTLCLSNGRFRVQSRWATSDGRSGDGQAFSLTGDTGYFWFFNSSNVEMVVKVLNACSLNSRVWVFAGGLTNVQVDLTVTDTQTGEIKIYRNPQNTAFLPIQDTSAFATCP